MNQLKIPAGAIGLSRMNSYHYLRQDADLLLRLAKSEPYSEMYERTQLSRTSILQYILSLEALINRALAAYLPSAIKEMVLRNEKCFGLKDKWEMLPALVSGDPSKTFDKSAYPWSHFKELVSLRNDYVHPKSFRPTFYRFAPSKTLDSLQPKDVPKGLTYEDDSGHISGVTEKTLLYCQTRIPKDPSQVLPEHAERIRTIVDDTVAELNQLMDGIIERDDWLLKEEFVTFIYPDEVGGKGLRWQRHYRSPNGLADGSSAL
jgi:hypothetical protein